MSHERIQSENFLSEAVTNFGTGNPSMRLNKLIALLGISEIENVDEATWESKTNGPKRVGETGEAKVTIGGRSIPESVAERWGWSGDSNEQMVLKIAHEFAHKFQHDKGYEQALVRALSNGAIDDSDQDFIPYISLYLALEGSGPVTGLGGDSFYREQSRDTGNLKVEVLEDMTELIAAYLISDEYLFHKLSTSPNNINQAQAEQIAILITQVCKDLD
jgi:hypothetical protein